MRTMLALCGLWCAAGSVWGAVDGPPKKAWPDLPDDRPCRRVEVVRQSGQSYVVPFQGTLDGAMTRMPIGYAAAEQAWEPNRSLLVENIGSTDVVSPAVLVGGRSTCRTLEELVAEATRGYTAPADRARAIWEYQRRRRFHACTWDGECSDALKVFHVYGYTLCGNEACVINDLWQAAGLTTRGGYPVGHVVTEVFYDGDYHLLDSDEHVICLRRDNRTIASEADVVRDHDLMKRTHTYGIGQAEHRPTDEFSASLYGYEGRRERARPGSCRPTPELRLRPGESLELRWDHIGKQYSAALAREPNAPHKDGHGELLAGWGPLAYDWLRNGKLRYQPDLSRALARNGAAVVENARFDEAAAAIRVADPANPATVVWEFASPYVFVGGRLTAQVQLGPGAAAHWRWSPDGKTWREVAGRTQSGTLEAVLDKELSPRGRPMYRFQAQLTLRGAATAEKIAMDHDIQTAALTLPELTVGNNAVLYTDASSGPREVRITHQWLARTAWQAPRAPADALQPRDGETVSGSRVSFAWTPAEHPQGRRIVDYHFELSEHADMRWPLSPNFERLTAHTSNKGQPKWTVPGVGLLNPGTRYYWRVRARDDRSVWGPWSKTFALSVRAPGVPQDVRLVPTGPQAFTLEWQAARDGERPAAYKVYGSDERGFSVSDEPYALTYGRGFVQSMEQYEAKLANAPDAGWRQTPANLIARVTATSLAVVGPECRLANTNRVYYRVVAIDAAGNESGPSDYAEAPHPWVVNGAPPTAPRNRPFEHQPQVLRSLGDLRCRASKKSSYNAAFWDREELTFRAVRLPAGLELDGASGRISGRPTAEGPQEIALEVTTPSGRSQKVSSVLTVLP